MGSAALALSAFFLVWMVVNLAGPHWADAVSIDRDTGTGIRLGGLLLAAGLAFGSAISGDWHSFDATLREFFIRSWPVLPALVVALGAERWLRRSAEPARSWLWAAGYAVLTVTCMAVEWHWR